MGPTLLHVKLADSSQGENVEDDEKLLDHLPELTSTIPGLGDRPGPTIRHLPDEAERGAG
jgi:hypothetical protein